MKRPLNIAFDIDDTLWKIRYKQKDQVPDYDLIQVLRWFHANGENIYFWSAGGIDYCQRIVNKLGLDELGKVIGKKGWDDKEGDPIMDIAFDDAPEIAIAKLHVIIDRS